MTRPATDVAVVRICVDELAREGALLHPPEPRPSGTLTRGGDASGNAITLIAHSRSS